MLRQRLLAGIGLHRFEGRQDDGQRLGAFHRLVPVQVQRRFQTTTAEERRARLLGHGRQPPPLLTCDHAQGLAQSVAQKVIRVFDPARTPQRAGIQRRPQLPRAEDLVLGGDRHRALDQPPIPVLRDQPRPKTDQRAFAERRRVTVQTIQRQLPPPIHHRCLDDFIVRHAGIGLQNRGQRQLGWRYRRLPLRAVGVALRQFGLKDLVEDLVPVLPQEHEQLRTPNPGDDLLLGRRTFDRRLPQLGTHGYLLLLLRCSQ